MKNQKVKFSIIREKEKLVGNSGCKLNIFKDKVFKIRKQSTNNLNSVRLLSQYEKILKFKNFKKISVPKIYNYKKSKKYFHYDMEYINGSTLSLFLMTQPLSESINVFKDVINFIFSCKKSSFSKYKNIVFVKKIQDIEKKNIFTNNFFKKIFKFLNNYNWNNIENSQSHGDLSLENVIIKNQTIKFIDLSENFVDSYKLDISKIMFDLISCWSFRKVSLKMDSLKVYSIKMHLLEVFIKKLSRDDFEDIKMLIILDFLRVLQYTKDINEINLLEKQLKIFYDNINNPLRW